MHPNRFLRFVRVHRALSACIAGLLLASLAVGVAVAQAAAQTTAQTTAQTGELEPFRGEVPQSTGAALVDLRDLLAGEVDQIPGNEFDRVLRNLRILVAADTSARLEIVGIAVAPVEGELRAETPNAVALAQRLQELALTMRLAADPDTPDEASLLVEGASLIDQAAGLIESGDWTPRLEVETP